MSVVLKKNMVKLKYPDGTYHGIDDEDTSALEEEIKGKMSATDPVGTGSFSMGRKADTVVGEYSHAEGSSTTASGNYSHAEGNTTTASGINSHVSGSYNIEDTSSTYAEIVGNGTSESARSNARTLDWNGNTWYAGNGTFAGGTITVGSTSLTEAQLQALIALLPTT